jgi:uncharacterized membrane protein
MKVDNIFLIHDWEIKKFLRVVLSVQIAVLGLLGMESLGFQIPILRSLIGFIYLTFIPGVLILRNLKLKNLSSIESTLYTIGLSITTLMFIGFLMNALYPVFGVSKPLSISYILVTVSGIVIFLSVLSYFRDDGYYKKEYLQIENVKLVLFLVLIPFLAILGTYLMNFYDKNSLIIILLVLISLISILSLFKFFKPSLYPLTIFVISIALLYHNSLISMHIWGFDITQEYYLASLVLKNAYWNSAISTDTNSMLSVVMLAPIYSSICKLSITWVFKIIYPFLFSMVPLGLYFIAEKYTSSKIAFLSIFYFMAVYMFFCDMLELARQEIAELFFVLLLLLTVSINMDKMKRSFLFIIFGVSLIVSHYGLSYIYIFYVVLTALIVLIINKNSLKFSKLPSKFKSKIKDNKSTVTLTLNFALFFVIFAVSWYLYTSNASPFISILNVFNHIFGNVFTDFLSPDTVQGVSIATSTETLFFHQVNKLLYLLSQFFIFIGLFSILLSRKTKFRLEYKILAFLSFLVDIFALVLPYFASSLQTSRVFQITLLILSPFFVLGIFAVFNLIGKIMKIKFKKDHILKINAIFLTMFLLFNSGIVYEFTGEIQPSMSLMSLDKSFDYTVFNDQETSSAEWLSYHKTNLTVYSDPFRSLLLNQYLGKDPIKEFLEDQKFNKFSLLYFGTFNTVENEISINSYANSSYGTTEYVKIKDLSSYNEIYDNHGSTIYLTN